MNITRLSPISVIAPLIFLTLAGCYPKTAEIEELYQRQAALEAKIDKLAQEMETGLSGISRDLDGVEANQQKLSQDVQALGAQKTETAEKTGRTDPKKNGKNPKTSQAKSKTTANTPEFIYSRAAASYSDGQYADAILEYQKLIDTYPKDKRVPEAYLKQGLSLINLGRKQEAKYFLNTLIDKYPNSREAQRAREKLKTI